MGKVVRWIFIDHFWPLLMQTTYFKAARLDWFEPTTKQPWPSYAYPYSWHARQILLRATDLKLTQSNDHESWGHTKGQRETGFLSKAWRVSEVRCQDGADHGAGVDGGVEPGEEGLHLGLLLRQLELFGSKGRNAWFDTSSTDGDQEKSNKRNSAWN